MKKDSSVERLPIVRQFQHTELPLFTEVFGGVYEKIDTDKMNFKDAVREMAKEIQKHWKDRNVYTIGLKHISKLSKHVNEYKQLQKRNPSQLPSNSTYFTKCDALNTEMNKLFDIFCEDNERRVVEENSCNIKMIDDDDFKFLHSMRTDRTFPCGRVDVTFHRDQQEKARKDEKRLQLQTSSFALASSDHAEERSENTDQLDKDNDYCLSPKNAEYRFEISIQVQRLPHVNPPVLQIYQVKQLDIFQLCESVIQLTWYTTIFMMHVPSLMVRGFHLEKCRLRMFKQSWTIPKEKDRESKYNIEEI